MGSGLYKEDLENDDEWDPSELDEEDSLDN